MRGVDGPPQRVHAQIRHLGQKRAVERIVDRHGLAVRRGYPFPGDISLVGEKHDPFEIQAARRVGVGNVREFGPAEPGC